MAVLGRTNRVFPPVWLELQVPPTPSDNWLENLVGAARATGAPIDVSTSPGLWGNALRGCTNDLIARGGTTVEQATSTDHAAILMQAEILQTLCALNRESIDIFFLRIRGKLEENQIEGALEALEMAKQEGHIRHLGISAEGPALAVLGTWHLHDAFELILVPKQSYSTLAPLAEERRVGIVTCEILEKSHPVLVGVRTPQEIEVAMNRSLNAAGV